ncbi:MAG TPA: 2-C-methyl-D-erythritol 4-phosphate cytidylyltransferase [Sphingobacteriaceae bacterium]|nr:2-C-methyl-D-erythritol 4-phosphate cytidylyltransferase [Sphingobacteriaceae bacterium]
MADFAIIVAAGTGQRMNSPLPKQFHELEEIPVLMRTLHAFHHSASQPEIILVLAPDWVDYWTERCYKYKFHVPHRIVSGGSTRFESVRNALEFIQKSCAADILPETVIAVHDGARPLVSTALIDKCLETAREKGAAAPALSCTDSVRMLNLENGQHAVVDRNRLRLMQTPQVFQAQLLLRAYQQSSLNDFTDDCTVVEKLGTVITLIPGEKTNLKITTTEDLIIAGAYLRQLRG